MAVDFDVGNRVAVWRVEQCSRAGQPDKNVRLLLPFLLRLLAFRFFRLAVRVGLFRLFGLAVRVRVIRRKVLGIFDGLPHILEIGFVTHYLLQ